MNFPSRKARFIAPAFQRFAPRRPRLPLVAALALLLGSAAQGARTFYVATDGDDTRSILHAQYRATPWRTIQKAADNMTVAGDICDIVEGIYRETVQVKFSGTLDAPILFRACDGGRVVLDGTESLAGWSDQGSNIWLAAMNWTLGEGNQLFQDGKMLPEARWPNAGTNFPWQDSAQLHPTNDELGDWSYVNSAGYTTYSNGWFQDAQLPPRPDGYWNGAIVNMLPGDGWYLFSLRVTGYSNATQRVITDDNRGASSAYAIKAGNEYYLTGARGELDASGEWFYDTATSRLLLVASNAPAGMAAKKRAYGFNLSGRSHISLAGLAFFACSVQSDTLSVSNRYDGLRMNFLGHNRKSGPSAFGLTLRSGDVLRNSELAWDSCGLVRLAGDDIRVINNDLHDSGYTPSGIGMVSIISGARARNLISHNTLRRSGRTLIDFPGRASIVEYNEMSDAMRLTSDGGVIHTALEAGNAVVRYNLMHDSPGPAGHSGAQVMGFYLDCQNSNWIVHHNIIWGVSGTAMQLNCTHNFVMYFNNTCWNTTRGSLSTGFPMNEPSGSRIFNNLFNGPLSGSAALWNLSDVRYNQYTDPPMVNPAGRNFRLQADSPAIDAGTSIPGITDGFLGAAPDLGALEAGGVDWTTSVGCSSTPPDPDPVYQAPELLIANQVRDGSFESGALSPNWTLLPGSNAGLLNGNAWTDPRLRSGAYDLQFNIGTSEVSQVVTGLLPGQRYTAYAALRRTNAAAVASLGVRRYGYEALERTADVLNRATPLVFNESRNGDASWWTVYNLSFVTGPFSTSAELYLRVAVPSAAAAPVFADDFGLLLTPAPDTPSDRRPLLHYPLDETAGSLAADRAANARTGTVYGASTWINGVLGNALHGNGTNSYLLTPALPSPTSTLTVCCWARSATTNWNDYGFLVSKRPSFTLHPNAGTRDVRFFVLIGGVARTVTYVAPAGFDITQWHHYAGVYDPPNSRLYLYIDGTAAVSGSVSGPVDPDNGSIYIGKDDYSGRYFQGDIDDVRLYDQALSATEIAALAHPDATLLLRLKVDDAAGSIQAWDLSTYGHAATLIDLDAQTAWDDGRVGGALSFDGVDGYALTPTLDAPTSAVTVACWARSAGSLWANGGCFAALPPTFALRPHSGSRAVGFEVTLDGVLQSVVCTPPATFDLTTWHHYAGLYDDASDTLALYVDGVLKVSRTLSGRLAAHRAPILLGRDEASGSLFHGALDDVQVFARALSWNELLELSVRGSGAPYELAPALLRNAHVLPYRESFERFDFVPESLLPGIDGWYGSAPAAGWVSADAPSLESLQAYTHPVGVPLRDEPHAQIACFDGTLTNLLTAPAGTTLWSDLMVYFVREPDAALRTPLPSQTAFALNTAGRLHLWHRDVAGGSNRWSALAWQTAVSAAWVRVTLQLDYATPDPVHDCRYFRLYLDGATQSNDLGFTVNDGSGAPGGPWFAMAEETTPTTLSAWVFDGSGAMDDLVVDTVRPLIGLGPHGTPEWWLADHGLTNQNSLAANELEDADADRFPNWMEHGADTDPWNPESLLRITELAEVENGRLPLIAQTVAGRRYTLEASTHLATGIWAAAAFGLSPSDTPAIQTVTASAPTLALYVEPAAPCRFYRLAIVPANAP